MYMKKITETPFRTQSVLIIPDIIIINKKIRISVITPKNSLDRDLYRKISIKSFNWKLYEKINFKKNIIKKVKVMNK